MFILPTLKGLAGTNLKSNTFKNAKLDLNFASTKSLVDSVTGNNLITFTRSSTGTYVGSDGLVKTATTDEARFNHNPTTGESLGLLVEDARTNLILQSEDLATTWTLGAGTVVTTNTWTAPNGTLTGDQFTIGSASIAPSQAITVTASSSYTLSFYLNATLTNAAFLRLRFATSAGSTSAFFNVSTLAFASLNGITNPVVQNVGNNTYKLSVTFTYDAVSAGSRTVAIAGVTTDNGSTADTGKIIAIWGVQYELGAFATSYIPTTTATVPRAADVTRITGTNFSSFYNQTEGTFFVDSNQVNLTPASRLISASDNTSSNRIILSRGSGSSGNINTSVTNAGSVQVSALLLGTSLTGGTSNKVAAVYKSADFAGSVNGLTAVTQGTGTVPSTVSQLSIGNGDILGTNTMTGTIKRLTYWATRLSNATLQAITIP